MKTTLLIIFFTLFFTIAAAAQTGLGKSTYTCIDKDGDGYGTGTGCLGPDADDNDASVQTASQGIAKYGSLTAFINHLGYNPSHICYLSTTGNDATAIKDDITHPWGTWGGAIIACGSGQMVLARGGTWTGVSVTPASGSTGNPTIVLAYPGELPFIDNRYPSIQTIGIDLITQNWVVIDGIKVAGGLGSVGCIGGGGGSDNIIIRHTETLVCNPGGIVAFNGLTNWTVEYNVMHDMNTAECANCQHGLYMGSHDLPSSNVAIRSNLVYNSNSYPGIQWNGRVTNLQMDGNVVYGTPDAANFSWMEGVSNSFFRNNVSFNSGSGFQIVNYDGDCYISGSTGICPYDQTGNIIENNTFYVGSVGPDGAGTANPALTVLNATSGCPTPPGECIQTKVGNLGGNIIRNNIFVSNGGATPNYPPVRFPMCTLASELANAACVLDTSETTLATTTFANNIFWNTGGYSGPGVVGTGPNPGFGYTPHTCADLAGGLAISSGCINADPGFIAASPSAYYNTPSLFNLALQPGSPALGAGTATGAPATDVWGALRANPPAIGAYESAGPSVTGPVLSSLSCAPLSLASGGMATCTVTLSQPAVAGGSLVVLSSNSLSLTVPANVSVAQKTTSITFTATAGTITTGQTAIVTATLSGSSQTASVILTAPTQVTSLSCTPVTLATGNVSTCTVTLTQSAAAAGETVAISSSTQTLAIPPGISVAGSNSATFSATAGTITAPQTAVLTAALNGASSTASIGLVTGGSWQTLSNTMLESVCPPDNWGGLGYPFTSMCANVVNAWNGGIADTKRNRLIVWGGGHSDYAGNEMYALNLAQAPPTMTRLTNPSAWNYAASYEVNPDGTPTSRHTYNGLVYLPVQDALFSFSGILPSGRGTNNTWMFTFADNTWHALDPVNGFNPFTITTSVTGAACAYDPNTQTVYCIDGNTNYLLQYNPVTNTYTNLSTGAAYPLAATPAIDPVRKLMIFMGNAADGATFKVSAIDISGADPIYAVQDWTAQVTGCAGMSSNWPGFVYDSGTGKFVGYPNQGGTVYFFDAGTKTCTAQTLANAPQTPSVIRGTFGRFQYFPALNTFALVNDAGQNAYSLLGSSLGSASSSPCDLNGDGKVDSTDVQIAIDQALGITACSSAALRGNGQCDVVDIQRIINASLGGACITVP